MAGKNRASRFAFFALTAIGALLCLLVCIASGQQLAKRLILKDGSYQLTTKWEVHGERVRYFSTERSEWEEVPNSMVDWAATEKYEKDRTTGVPLPEAVEFDKRLAAERAAEEAKRPEVAPGLRLPADGGVLLLDTFDSQPQLVPLEEKVVQINQKGKGGVACDALNKNCAGNQVPTVKDNVEIARPHADVQAHAAVPVLYVKLEQGSDGAASPQEVEERLEIVRVQAKNDRRVVAAIRVSGDGKGHREPGSVEASVEPVAEGWMKITPAKPLASGEYGLVELAHGNSAKNLNMQSPRLPDSIWDFGVNPAAPANSLALKPEIPAAGEPPAAQKHP
jgi:hypothetical protein